MDAITGGLGFEIAFVTESLVDAADERIDRVAEFIPNLVVSSDGELTLMTTLVRGSDAIEAGVTGARAIESSGIRVIRTYQDLVTRQDVADRLSVTRQAVGNWVRGERHDDAPFPAPVSLVAGGVWLWGDVAEWARERGFQMDQIQYPSLTDHNRLDLLITTGIRSVRVSTMVGSGDIAFRGGTANVHSHAHYQTRYALAS